MWDTALVNYRQARQELPEMSATLDARIQRARRNIRRQHFAVTAWIIAAIILSAGVFFHHSPVPRKTRNAMLWVFAVLVCGLSLWAWLIHEQFTSTMEICGLVLGIIISAILGSFLSIRITRRWRWGRQKARLNAIAGAGIGTVCGLLFFLAGVYLTLYYVHVHYLIIYGL